MYSNEKEEVSHSFKVDIFTKSLHRGGVIVPWLYAFYVKNKKTPKTYKDSLAFARYTIMIRGQEMSQNHLSFGKDAYFHSIYQ